MCIFLLSIRLADFQHETQIASSLKLNFNNKARQTKNVQVRRGSPHSHSNSPEMCRHMCSHPLAMLLPYVALLPEAPKNRYGIGTSTYMKAAIQAVIAFRIYEKGQNLMQASALS